MWGLIACWTYLQNFISSLNAIFDYLTRVLMFFAELDIGICDISLSSNHMKLQVQHSQKFQLRATYVTHHAAKVQ